jgi:hypothetical protein
MVTPCFPNDVLGASDYTIAAATFTSEWPCVEGSQVMRAVITSNLQTLLMATGHEVIQHVSLTVYSKFGRYYIEIGRRLC